MIISFLLLVFSSLSFSKNIEWFGHRGARGLYPENTINGMKEALKYPITTLEMDVVISKDGQIVVSHDHEISEEICFVSQPKKKHGPIYLWDLEYEKIKEFDCGSKQHPRFTLQKKVTEHKPLLKDLIDSLEKTMAETHRLKNYSIEIKSTSEAESKKRQPDYKKFSDSVATYLLKRLPPSRFSLQSFDQRVLKYLHEEYPEITLVALQEDPYTPEKILAELGFSPDIFAPDWKLLKPEDVTYFHNKNIDVIPWTINEAASMSKVLAWDVDGLMTDYPDLIATLGLPELKPGPEMKCGKGHHFFEKRCVKIPVHALPSSNNPGWVCKYGHVQKRKSCLKIQLPTHAKFLEDGKTWQCKEGWERYRGSCQKK